MGRNNAEFNGYQVNYQGLTDSHQYGNGTPMHHFTATKNGAEVGFALFEPSGTLDTMMIDPEHQRKGIGTAIWNAAKTMGLKVAHSSIRTPAGDKFAKAMGGYRPRNEYQ